MSAMLAMSAISAISAMLAMSAMRGSGHDVLIEINFLAINKVLTKEKSF